jgi:hypothetical protein
MRIDDKRLERYLRLHIERVIEDGHFMNDGSSRGNPWTGTGYDLIGALLYNKSYEERILEYDFLAAIGVGKYQLRDLTIGYCNEDPPYKDTDRDLILLGRKLREDYYGS